MKKIAGALAALLVLGAFPAAAEEPIAYQGTVTLPTGVTALGSVPVSVINPLPVTGSISATTSATASSAPTAVVAGTGKPLNIGLFSNLFVTAVDSSGNIIDPNAALPAGSNVIGGITCALCSTSANQTSQITQETATAGVLGTTADASSATGTIEAIEKYIAAQMTTALPAGTNLIGKVGIDQTTDGTTNAVHLVAGTALAGKVGLDQTTPGTTNGVSIAQIGATTVVNGGLAGSLAVGGTAAANASANANPILDGCEFKTTTTAATTGQLQFLACGDGFGNAGKSFTPAMATQITAQSATTANTGNTATLAAAGSKFTYISGFACTSGGATAASLITVTVAGTITGSLTYTMAIPAGVTLAATPLIVSFPNPIQGSAASTAITVTIGAAGSGNTVEQCNAQGFQQ